MHSVIFARDATPPPGVCNQTGYITYAIADLWLNRNPADVNAKLTKLRFSHFGGDPSACGNSNQARNNLMLGLLVRPYFLYNPASSWFPGRLTAAASNNLVAQMWTLREQVQQGGPGRGSVEHLRQREPRRAGRELLLPRRADLQEHARLQDQALRRRPHTVAQQYAGVARTTGASTSTSAPSTACSSKSARRPTHGYTLGAILNIYNFAEDPILRKKAGMILDLDFADYAQQNYNGILGGAKSRSYPDDSYDGTLDSMTNLGKLLFGPRRRASRPTTTSSCSRRAATARRRSCRSMAHEPRRARELRVHVAATRATAPISPDDDGNWHVDTEPERAQLRVRHPRLRAGHAPS